jgi:hypothetical protein
MGGVMHGLYKPIVVIGLALAITALAAFSLIPAWFGQ